MKPACPFSLHSAASRPAPAVDAAPPLSPDDHKKLDTIRARLALKRYALDTFSDGSYMVIGVNLACRCRDLAALIQFSAILMG